MPKKKIDWEQIAKDRCFTNAEEMFEYYVEKYHNKRALASAEFPDMKQSTVLVYINKLAPKTKNIPNNKSKRKSILKDKVDFDEEPVENKSSFSQYSQEFDPSEWIFEIENSPCKDCPYRYYDKDPINKNSKSPCRNCKAPQYWHDNIFLPTHKDRRER